MVKTYRFLYTENAETQKKIDLACWTTSGCVCFSHETTHKENNMLQTVTFNIHKYVHGQMTILDCYSRWLLTMKLPESQRIRTESHGTVEAAIVVIAHQLAHVKRNYLLQPRCKCTVATFPTSTRKQSSSIFKKLHFSLFTHRPCWNVSLLSTFWAIFKQHYHVNRHPKQN